MQGKLLLDPNVIQSLIEGRDCDARLELSTEVKKILRKSEIGEIAIADYLDEIEQIMLTGRAYFNIFSIQGKEEVNTKQDILEKTLDYLHELEDRTEYEDRDISSIIQTLGTKNYTGE